VTIGDVVTRAPVVAASDGLMLMPLCGVVIDAWPFSSPHKVRVLWEPIVMQEITEHAPVELVKVALAVAE
jgi:hypothetical protein